ncbi:MAG: hypothetical protein R6V45_13050 [Oceanipulchritudo sp.]
MGIKSSSEESPPAGNVETLEKEPGRIRKDNDMKGYTKERRDAVIALFVSQIGGLCSKSNGGDRGGLFRALWWGMAFMLLIY